MSRNKLCLKEAIMKASDYAEANGLILDRAVTWLTIYGSTEILECCILTAAWCRNLGYGSDDLINYYGSDDYYQEEIDLEDEVTDEFEELEKKIPYANIPESLRRDLDKTNPFKVPYKGTVISLVDTITWAWDVLYYTPEQIVEIIEIWENTNIAYD